MNNFTVKSRKRKPILPLLLFLIIAAGLVVGVLAFQRYRSPAPQVAGKPSSDYELAAWEWRGPFKFSVDDLPSYMEFAKSERMSTIYLNIGEVIDIYELPDQAEKAKKLSEFTAIIRQFTQAAHRHGIDVHGLSGSVQWAEPDYRYLPLQVMDYVKTYNKSAALEERLDGVQFDIEVYNKKDFDTNKSKALEDFLATAVRIQSEVQRATPALALGFAVPYWFDNENNNIPEITYNGVRKPTAEHLLDILNTTQGGYLAIMDYRDQAAGKNGAIAHAEDEMRYAETQAKNVQVVIGQLINDTKPTTTTFFDEEPEHMYSQLALINERFRGSANYGGLAVHDLKSFKKFVKDKPEPSL
jgi:hypothetical protein